MDKNFTLTKTKYCTGIGCPKSLWLTFHNKDEFDTSVLNQSVLDNGSAVGNLAMRLFGDYVEVPFSDDVSDMISSTQKLLDKEAENICEASFAHDGCFCSVDILRNLGNKEIEFYEVKSSTKRNQIYIDDIAYQYYILARNGFTIKKACLVYINNEYVRKGKLDLHQLFKIEELTKEANDKLSEIAQNISKFKSMLAQPEPNGKMSKDCKSCGFFKHCINQVAPVNSLTLYDIENFPSKQKFIDKNLYTFNDIYNSGLLTNKALQQVEVELKNLPPQINKPEIKKFLGTLTYPLYFLDFETFNPCVPMYDNSKPYQQITFQYSLHYIQKEGGALEHKEFLAYSGKDPRRTLAEQLCKDIPLNVCTTAYNMPFEKTRIKELAELYPDLSEHLMNIHDNIKDLMIPFKNRFYYTKEMQGSYSIKAVLPALYPNNPTLNYHNLEGVHNGGEASETFLKMQEMPPKEMEKCRGELLKYCGLDTLAMVKVWEKLRDVVKEKE